MRVLVTGGAGFIGSHVVDAFLADGHEVHVLDDLSTGRRENVAADAVFHEVDLRDPAAVRTVFDEARPEVVSHQGAQTSVSVSVREPRRDAEINVLGTLAVLDACVATGVRRLVFASTGGAIYGEVPEGERATVDRYPRPISPYACSKLAGEAYLASWRAEHGLESTVLRYGNVYGPRQDPHGEAGVVAIFSKRLLAGEPLQINARRETGDPGCVRDYVYVDDVVEANRRALAGAIAEPVVNVATGVPATTEDIARRLAEAGGIAPKLVHAGRRAGDLERSVLDPGALPPTVDLADGLARTISWFRDAG